MELAGIISEKKIPKKGTAEFHQHKIALDTVKNPMKGKFMGGPSYEESIEILTSKFGYSKADIRKLQLPQSKKLASDLNKGFDWD